MDPREIPQRLASDASVYFAFTCPGQLPVLVVPVNRQPETTLERPLYRSKQFMGQEDGRCTSRGSGNSAKGCSGEYGACRQAYCEPEVMMLAVGRWHVCTRTRELYPREW